MFSESSDLLVVGAGVFGAWIALLARRAGYSVRLIDQYGPANQLSSSAGKSRITRMAYADDEVYTRLAAQSLEIWKNFFAETGQFSCFQQTGVLWMATNDDPGLLATQSTFDRVGITYEALNYAEIRRRYPQIRVSQETRAIFEPNSGALLAEPSVKAVIQATTRAGVEFETTKVQPVPIGTNHLDAVTTQDGQKRSAGLFVFACGSWLPKIFPDVLANIISPTRQELFFFETPKKDKAFRSPALPVWIDGTDNRLPYGFPDLEDAGIKLAFHRLGPSFDPDIGNRHIADHQVREAAGYLYSRFPALGGAAPKTTVVCHYENTANGDLLIDRHPLLQNVWLVGGGSGHGFKHAPGVAEILLRSIPQGQVNEERFTLSSKQETRKRVV